MPKTQIKKKNKECTVRFRKHGKENLFTLSVSQLSVGAGNTWLDLQTSSALSPSTTTTLNSDIIWLYLRTILSKGISGFCSLLTLQKVSHFGVKCFSKFILFLTILKCDISFCSTLIQLTFFIHVFLVMIIDRWSKNWS